MAETDYKIVLIEDEAAIRKFLRISLEAEGYQVHEARLGLDGLALCAQLAPDLVILDLGLPDIDGQQLIPRLREWSQVPLLVLSVRSDEQEKVRALDAGANDYLTKPFGIGELMARLRVLRRDRVGDAAGQSGYECAGLRVSLPTREVWVDGNPIRLTRKEYELLRLLVRADGRILTHAQIMRQLWDAPYADQTQHLRVLVGQLRSKLGDDPRAPRFILTEQGVGYRFVAHS